MRSRKNYRLSFNSPIIQLTNIPIYQFSNFNKKIVGQASSLSKVVSIKYKK